MTDAQHLDADARRALAAVYAYLVDVGRKRAAGAPRADGEKTGGESVERGVAGRPEDTTAHEAAQGQGRP